MVKCPSYRIPLDLVRSFRRLRIGRIIPGILKSKWRRGKTLVIDRAGGGGGGGGGSRRGSLSHSGTFVKKERPRGMKRKSQSPPLAPAPAAAAATAPEQSSQEEKEVSPRKLIRASRRRHHSVGQELSANDFSVIIIPRREARRRSTPIQSFTVQEMTEKEEEVEEEDVGRMSEDSPPKDEVEKGEGDFANKDWKACNRRTYIKLVKGRGFFGIPKMQRSPPPPPSN